MGFLNDTTIYWNHNMKITQQLHYTVEVEYNTNVRFSSPVSTCSLLWHWLSLVDRKEYVAWTNSIPLFSSVCLITCAVFILCVGLSRIQSPLYASLASSGRHCSLSQATWWLTGAAVSSKTEDTLQSPQCWGKFSFLYDINTSLYKKHNCNEDLSVTMFF